MTKAEQAHEATLEDLARALANKCIKANDPNTHHFHVWVTSRQEWYEVIVGSDRVIAKEQHELADLKTENFKLKERVQQLLNIIAETVIKQHEDCKKV